jgi:hypothetical protein
MSETQHQLQWRGRSSGPWTLTQIREALDSGTIHSLYRICVSGEWLTLRDYLEQIDAVELERRAATLGMNLRQKEAEKPRDHAFPIRRTMGFETQVSRPNFFGKPPPVFIKGAADTRSSVMDDGITEPPTCWLAVAAFVVSCACFVPYLNLVSWLPGIVLGHLALQKLERQPTLEGRGLAVGALIVSYATIIFAVVTGLLFPHLFFRVFPVGDA